MDLRVFQNHTEWRTFGWTFPKLIEYFLLSIHILLLEVWFSKKNDPGDRIWNNVESSLATRCGAFLYRHSSRLSDVRSYI